MGTAHAGTLPPLLNKNIAPGCPPSPLAVRRPKLRVPDAGDHPGSRERHGPAEAPHRPRRSEQLAPPLCSTPGPHALPARCGTCRPAHRRRKCAASPRAVASVRSAHSAARCVLLVACRQVCAGTPWTGQSGATGRPARGAHGAVAADTRTTPERSATARTAVPRANLISFAPFFLSRAFANPNLLTARLPWCIEPVFKPPIAANPAEKAGGVCRWA